jgi:putative transposase
MKVYNKKKRVFKLKFKTKKDVFNTINIEKQMISSKQILFANYKINGKKVFTHNNINDNLDKYDYGDSSISYNRILNRYYLNLTYSKTTTKCKNNKVCSIDPGVKNFVTLFSDNHVSKIGINCKERINKINKEIDIIKSRISRKEYVGNNGKVYKNTKKRRRQLRKAQERKQVKLSNLIKELHFQTANHLTSKYSLIINTPFESQKMVRTLGKQTSRLMNNLSYYKFKNILQSKCEERNVKLEIKDEFYTSKTCTCCGKIKYNLKNENEYNCEGCGIKIDRDINGARNIFLRNYKEIKGIDFALHGS